MSSSKSYSSLIIFSGIVLSALILFFSGEEDVSLHIMSIVILATFSIFSVKIDIYHPLSVYIATFALYSVGYAILYNLDIYTSFGYSKESMVCMWFAMCVCFLYIPPKRIIIPPSPSKYLISHLCPLLRILITIFSTISYLGLVYILLSGFSNKSELYESGGLMIKLVCTIVYFNTLYFTIYFLAALVRKKKICIKWFCFNFLSIALFGIITGERDYFFHIVLILCISLALTGHIKKKHLPILLFAGMMLIVLTKTFKYVFLSGESSGFAMSELFVSFLDGEFTSAGRNLQVLVDEGYKNYFGGKSLLLDLARVFFDVDFSTQKWFNDDILYYINTGYGFTIVGEGYVNGGFFGIFVVMSISSLILRFIYLKARTNFIYLVVFVYMLPQYIYATRADITNIISPLLKRVFLGLVFLFIIAKMIPSQKDLNN